MKICIKCDKEFDEVCMIDQDDTCCEIFVCEKCRKASCEERENYEV